METENIMNTISGLSKFWEMLAVTSLLPLLAVFALLLRRNFVNGWVKTLMLTLGLILLSYAIYDAVIHHADDIGQLEIIVASVAALITYFILSFAHKHTVKNGDVKGIALAEFFHGLMDGLVIGAAYLINPLLGWATVLAIATHELPKILGTVVLIRSLTTNAWDAVKYSALCQAGVPLAATFVYAFGKNISGEWSHAVEFASLATLAVIIIRVAYHSYTHRGHSHE